MQNSVIHNSSIAVLHVDDEPFFLEITRRYLDMIKAPIALSSTTSPIEAIEMIAKENFDVIISDYEMPEMNGLELLNNLKEKGYDIPFIILTGRGREEVAIQALNLGAQFYVQKIPNTKVLFTELLHYIQMAHQEHKARIEKEQIKKNLLEREKLYSRLFTKANIGMMHCTPLGTILEANEKSTDLFGLPKDKLINKNFLDLFIEADKSKIAYALQEIEKTGETTIEGRVRNPFESVPVEILMNKILINDHASVQIMVRDITTYMNTIDTYADRIKELNILFPALIDNVSLKLKDLVTKLQEVKDTIQQAEFYSDLIKYELLSQLQEATILVNAFRITFNRHLKRGELFINLADSMQKASRILSEIYPRAKINLEIAKGEDIELNGNHDLVYLLFFVLHLIFKSTTKQSETLKVHITKGNQNITVSIKNNITSGNNIAKTANLSLEDIFEYQHSMAFLEIFATKVLLERYDCELAVESQGKDKYTVVLKFNK